MSISSFVQNGHTFHLYVYDDIAGVPEGTVVKDANEIVPAERIFKYREHDSFSGFSNLFRYRLLLEKGGCWVDTDVVCMRPFRFEQDHLFVNVLEGRPFFNLACVHTTPPFITFGRGYYINSWFIKAPAGSAIMDYCYRESLTRDTNTLDWGDIGPRLMTAAVKLFDMERYIVPYETFFPINEHQWRQLISGSPVACWKWRNARNRSYGVHLYHEMWRRNNINMNATFPADSIYEKLKQRYLSNA
ncbi:glycosyltransferase [Candidatus Latescibacterota bacterium]